MDFRTNGIAWSSDLETNDERIDSQHKELFRLTSDLIYSCARGESYAMLGKALDFLAQYTVQHFADEEALQIQYNYPDYTAHKKLHDDFKQTVTGLITQYKSDNLSVDLNSTLNSIVVRWLVQHIKQEDAKIAKHIRSLSAANKDKK
ncbi:MAG: bacteriohemerythrin [Spirochaetia bacterium]|nr:bacteriohemerythrin [Spirochaetia bacterium]